MFHNNKSNKEPELHLVIIWEKARNMEKEIIGNIISSSSLKILECYDVSWSPECVSSNFSRLYGTHLPENSYKEKECGSGRFLIITLLDTASAYNLRETSRGHEYVNVNLFDRKIKYREWTGGGHKIHTTNTPKETEHDITLLLGKNSADYLAGAPDKWDGTFKLLKHDLIGARAWRSLKEIFYVLNSTVKYAVLRNHEDFPDIYATGEHSDIDLLVECSKEAAFVLNATPAHKEHYRVRHSVKIDEEIVYFDLRYIGDDYYCKKFEKNMLDSRFKNTKNIYVLNDENYFYSLVYHALIHKRSVASDYFHITERLAARCDFGDHANNIDTLQAFDLYFQFLIRYMDKNCYNFTIPQDKSVYFNSSILQTCETADYVKKEFRLDASYPYMVHARAGSGYRYLIALKDNLRLFIKTDGLGSSCVTEYKVSKTLHSINSKNFILPLFYRHNSSGTKLVAFKFINGISLLDALNSPIEREYLVHQLYDIAKALWESDYVHRDIRPQNFIVTEENTLILFDMQFAVNSNKYNEYTELKRNTKLLQQLGEDYAFGKFTWDDMYSLRKILQLIGMHESYRDLYLKVDSFLNERIGRKVISFKQDTVMTLKKGFLKCLAALAPTRKLRKKIRRLYWIILVQVLLQV